MTELNENRDSAHHDPLTELGAADFPFEQIFRELDGDDGGGERRKEELVSALKVLLTWFAEPFKDKTQSDKKLDRTGKRVLAALWVLNPGCFREGPISAAELSRQIGNNRVVISDHASEFTRRFGLRNRFQSHGRNGEHAAILKHNES